MSKTFKKFTGARSHYPGNLDDKSKFKKYSTDLYDDYPDYEPDETFLTKAKFKHMFLFALLISLLGSSCVSKKMLTKEQDKSLGYYEQLALCQEQSASLDKENNNLTNSVEQLEMQLSNEYNKVALQEQQLEYFRSTNTNLLDRLADLSVVSKSGAESIKKSLEALNDQSKYIKDLTSSIRQRDSINLALVMNLKRSLIDVNDEDITIEVKKGVVYISISDKMLFKSGSAEIMPQAETVLGKIARVLNDHNELEILVEGHTDNVPISTSCMADNWDLSVKRATSVVRNLQKKHGIAPERMTAGGRSEFVPKASNTSPEGRQSNRRTEIIILPELDQFFQLLEPGMEMSE